MPPVLCAPFKRTFTSKQVGTRYMLVGVRTLLVPNDPADMKKAHALQDAVKVEPQRRTDGRRSAGRSPALAALENVTCVQY